MSRAGTLPKQVTTNIEDINTARKEVELAYNQVFEQLERSKIELHNIHCAYEIMADSENRKTIDKVLDQKISLFQKFEAKQQKLIQHLKKGNAKDELQGISSQLAGLNLEINKALNANDLLGLLVKLDLQLDATEQLKEQVASKIGKKL